ncbi:MAG: hypothetical protein KC621_00540 [Myxococcales bacterium]|nr:hypothetical protein [Myxococcales bacterium]
MQRSHEFRVVAQDPTVVDGNQQILTAVVKVPWEPLDEGPRGHRVAVIDFDATTGRLYDPWMPDPARRSPRAPSNQQIETDAAFHAQHTYAVVMRTLARFEKALGRRVEWAFDGQQLKVAPHAFRHANAFYSRDHQALLFGYFPSRERPGSWVWSCLSHDVVAHETTHAIVDGLRRRFLDRSHPDQAAFHEGYADVVALLSVFSLPLVVEQLLWKEKEWKGEEPMVDPQTQLIARSHLSVERLRHASLFGLAEQLGSEMSGGREEVLRRSASLDPQAGLEWPDEPHERGEIFAAALLNSFVAAWSGRLRRLGDRVGALHMSQVAEEASAAAETLLDIIIRALDYTPPVDLRFEDFLAALLTSDSRVRPDDSRWSYRAVIRDCFRRYRIHPPEGTTDDGTWYPATRLRLVYDHTHLESIQRSPEEVFRFLWANRQELGITDQAYAHVLSVRPSLRVGEDGFLLRETVAEYKQDVDLTAGDLHRFDVRQPDGMPDDQPLRLSGGGTLVFDEYGRLELHVYQRVFGRRQTERLQSMWSLGLIPRDLPEVSGLLSPFGVWHQRRAARDVSPKGW